MLLLEVLSIFEDLDEAVLFVVSIYIRKKLGDYPTYPAISLESSKAESCLKSFWEGPTNFSPEGAPLSQLLGGMGTTISLKVNVEYARSSPIARPWNRATWRPARRANMAARKWSK
jgi:hypothetical protein